MASLMPPTNGDLFACANPKDTIYDNPMDLPAAFPGSFLPNCTTTTTTHPLATYLSDPSPNQNLDPLSPQFSYDGAPSWQYPDPSFSIPREWEQYDWGSSRPQHNPTSHEDDHFDETTTATTASSPSPPVSARKKPTGRKPGRRALKLHDTQRERFLEKNRIAANKHRKRKKEYIQDLETRYGEQLSRKNSLKEEVLQLRREALTLQEKLFDHTSCNNNRPIQDYLTKRLDGVYAGKVPGPQLVDEYLL